MVSEGRGKARYGVGKARTGKATEMHRRVGEKTREVKHGNGEAQYGIVTDKIREVVRRIGNVSQTTVEATLYFNRREIMETRRIRVTLIDEMLGTNPGNKEVHEKFINSKAPDAETREQELEHLPAEDMIKNEMTVFYRDDDGNPAMACYHMYGFFKSACGFLRKVKDTESIKLKAYKKAIDGLIKCYPDASDPTGRYLTLHMPDGSEIDSCQRPLRAQTMQGERVALANSETVPVGTWFECDIVTFDDSLWDAIEEWLNYGQFNGLGQWRSSGKGAFVWEYVERKER